MDYKLILNSVRRWLFWQSIYHVWIILRLWSSPHRPDQPPASVATTSSSLLATTPVLILPLPLQARALPLPLLLHILLFYPCTLPIPLPSVTPQCFNLFPQHPLPAPSSLHLLINYPPSVTLPWLLPISIAMKVLQHIPRIPRHHPWYITSQAYFRT